MTNNEDRIESELFNELMTPRTAWTAEELLATDFPEIAWAVPGLIAEGLTVLAGAPKVGKSWLCLNLAVAVASGGRAFGKVDVAQGGVLYAALEDTGRRLRDRLAKVLNGDPAPPGLTFETRPLPFNYMLDYVREWVGRTPDARLVIIDVLAKIRPTSTARNDYDADYSMMGAIKRVADECRVAIVVVHHKRKLADSDTFNEISGTNGIVGAADASVVLNRVRETAEATLHITGRDVEEAAFPLTWDNDTYTWTRTEGPAGLGEGAKRTIYDYLRGRSGALPKQIAEDTGLNPSTVKVEVRRMLERGQIDYADGYYLAPDPRAVEDEPVLAWSIE